MIDHSQRHKVHDHKAKIEYGYFPRRLLIYILMFRAGATPVNATFKDYVKIEKELLSIVQINNIKRIHLRMKKFDVVKRWVVTSSHQQDMKTMEAFKEMLLNPY